MTNVAIIPARGGSQRIQKKNIKDFNGKPIISYAIQSALDSEIFDSVVVSTDSEEIADISKQYGAEVPFRRNKKLADDYTSIHEVIADSIMQLSELKRNFEYACCIYATAPFIDKKDLIEGFKKINIGNKKIVIASTNYSYPVHRAFFKKSKDEIEMLFPENFNKRSQDLEEVHHDAGQFVWASSKTWLSKPIPFGKQHDTIHIPNWRVQDIDTYDDWKRAEMIAKLIQNN